MTALNDTRFHIDQIAADYERDGVVCVREFVSAAQLDRFRRLIAEYQAQILPHVPAGDYVLEPDGQSVRNMWRLDKHDPRFREFADRPDIRELIGRLVHGEPVLAGVETFNKPARIGSAVPAHQDNAYFCQSPPDMLTVWIAIDAATTENGPVYYLKGSHRQGDLPAKFSGVSGNSMGLATPPDLAAYEPLCGTLAPGDALIHHCQTIHYSAPNHSSDSRLGLLFVFRGAHTQSDPQLKQAYAAAQS